MSNRTAAQAHGSFFLASEARCAGVKLAPGYYSLSVWQSGKRDVVRLTPLAIGARGRALEVMATPRLTPEAPNGLLVDRINQQRTLIAISLQQPGVTLFLQTGKSSGRFNGLRADPHFISSHSRASSQRQLENAVAVGQFD